MNVASKELCEELYAVSGWYPEPAALWGYYWFDIDLRTGKPCEWKIARYFGPRDPEHQIAAYDLGYLLRKLPTNIGSNLILEADGKGKDKWCIYYDAAPVQIKSYYNVTPEDAAAKLCIELFNQGILTRQGK